MNKSIILKAVILFFLILFASFSVFYAAKIAITYGSSDFQYSPTLLFLEKINPYKYFLDGNNDQKLLLAQFPIYSHMTYILFAPFAFFEWEIAKILWTITNLFLVILILFFLKKNSHLKNYHFFILALIFFSSTPFRNVISNGQHTFLVLFFSCFFFLKNKFIKYFFFGFAFFKYSFMPIGIFFIFFKDGIKYLLISLIPLISGWLFFSIYLNINPLNTIFDPLKAAFSNGFDTTLARGDLFTIIGNLNFIEFNINYLRIPILVIISFLIAKKIKKYDDKLLIVSLFYIGNLFTFGHLIYDYIVLLPCFFISILNSKNIYAKISILIVLYFWFGIRIIEYFKMYILKFNSIPQAPTSLEVFFNFILLIALFYLNLNINKKLN